jgi:hypothetical protein
MGKFILEGVIQNFSDYKHNGRIYPQNVFDSYLMNYKRNKRMIKITTLLNWKVSVKLSV